MSNGAFEAIRALEYRYLRTLDLKLWDEFGETLGRRRRVRLILG
ncbi:hypothetical protein ACWDUL_04345 [Nocardia niigatensis]|nr:hypothetical protein [Nocardia niigatensis]